MTNRTDIFGQDVDLGSDAALAHWNALQMAFLAHSAQTPVHLGALLEADPEFALGHAVKGLFYLLLGRRELVSVAEEALSCARVAATSRKGGAREDGVIEALEAWLRGSPLGAISAMERILAAEPQDALAMKLGHAMRFIIGDAKGMRSSLERVMPTYDATHPARGYLYGCQAFAMEETGDYARAETLGRMGLGLAPDDAWGLHAVAHVFEMTGNARGGLDWLTGREAAWAHCNNFRYHVWWHKALMHLDQGETEHVLALYDTEIRADKTDDYRDIANATSLLMRLDLDGVPTGDRWDELAELSAGRTEDGSLIFADLHYMLALSAGKRDDAIARMMVRMHHDAAEGRSEMAAVTAHPGIAAAAGLEAFGAGDFDTAYRNLARAGESLPTIGGSHAQRDVFARLTIDAAIRAGYLPQAHRLLAGRSAQRAGTTDRYTDARQKMIDRAYAASPSLLNIAE